MLGLSGPGVVKAGWLADMADDAIVFAMANPVPEVMPADMPRNVAVVATGRSDFPNQINNVLAFPGVFRGLLDTRARRCTPAMKQAAAPALRRPRDRPGPAAHRAAAFEPGVADAVAAAVKAEAVADGGARPGRGRPQGPKASSAVMLATGRDSHRVRPGAVAYSGRRSRRWWRTAARPTRRYASASRWAYSVRTP